MTTPLALLLVEDSRTDAELVLIELRRHGYEPDVTRVDSEEGLRTALAAGRWELVVCDHGMPGFSSTEALQIVQETADELPFVILSGTIGEERAVEALKSGVRDVVVKDNLSRLGPVVARELTEAANRREQRRLESERHQLENELRRLNDELRASERRYRLLFDHNPQPLLVYDRQTLQIVTANQAMVADYGYSNAELRSMVLTQLVPPDYADRLAETLETNITGVSLNQTGHPASHPWRHLYKDGTIIDVEVASANLALDGRDCRIVLCHDVTERNRAVAALARAHDEAVEASNMKSAFLANMSHEIRTPMNGVIGMNELLLATGLEGEQRFFADQIQRSSEHMIAIIDDMLDISKIETGQLRLHPDRFSLHEAIEQVCATPAIEARAKGLRFDAQIDPQLPLHAHGDGGRLRQILLNLVANAVKFTDQGAIDVNATLAARDERSITLHCEVADTGIGIEPDSLDRMFEPFTQADTSTTRRHGGTGLGLAIARELVALMHGTIGGHSVPGAGTTFWFEIQLETVSSDSQPDVHTPSPPPPADRREDRAPLILVAEDSPINQIVTARTLERCGCQTHLVADGHAALEALARRRYDAVLMDCQMPTLDGYQTTAELRAREHPYQHTPVIAMTAHAMPGDRDKCIAAGMDDYITKPIRRHVLIDTLQRWLPTHTLQHD